MAKLTINEAVQGYTHRLAFDFNDCLNTSFLSNLGAVGQKIVGTLPAGAIIDAATVYQITAAAGNTEITIDFGTQTNDPDELIDAAAIGNLATNPVITNTGDGWATNTAQLGVVNATTAQKNLYMELNPATGLAALTAGSWVLAWRQTVVPLA